MTKDNKCVYLHKDKEGIVRYVGSGSTDRANLTSAKSKRGKKYEDFVNVNGRMEVEIVVNDLSKLEAEDLERVLYDKYRITLLNCRRPNSVRLISKEMFQEYLYYDETSSTCLKWKVDYCARAKVNSEAGCLNSSTGYYSVMLKGISYQNHRVIAILHGLDVNGNLVDHKDRNKTNNKINNLRAVNSKVNSQNRGLSSRNSSGCAGVSYNNRDKSWIVSWCENGVIKHKYFVISKYNSPEDAFIFACEYRKLMRDLHYDYINTD